MDKPMRVSALSAHHKVATNSSGSVTLSEIPDLSLWQLAVWPQTLTECASGVARELGINSVPGFGSSQSIDNISMLRIEPLKFWVIGAPPATPAATDGSVLDLSHSRTHVRIAGGKAVAVLNSYLPLDLRNQSFPVGTVASTAFHHVGVTLWRTDAGYELFIPRGFAVSLWQLLCEASEQYGLIIV